MEKSTKEKILTAMDSPEVKTLISLCRDIGIHPQTFYFHYYKDSEFKKKVLEKRREKLTAQIEATA